MSQAALLKDRRFWPLFWTQFFGAFNDNFLKSALITLVTYKSWSIFDLSPGQVNAAASGCLILPFLLFSGVAGRFADKTSKTTIVRAVKIAEVAIMAVGLVGFSGERVDILLLVVFAMGLHSTVFGPVKYSMLPELVRNDELIGATALVEAGTFVAIPLANFFGVALASTAQGTTYVGVAAMAIAVVGTVTSLFVPRVKAQAPDLKMSFNLVRPTIDAWRLVRQTPAVFNAVLGISWFTFIALALLTFVPTFGKDQLGLGPSVLGLLMVTFPVGIAIGAMLCERLSNRRLELGLVPFGTLGMTWFILDVFLTALWHKPTPDAELLGLREFLSSFMGLRVLFDFTMLAVFSGFFTVPLYTLMQQRAEPSQRSRVIAGNNIFNALFGVLASVFLLLIPAEGFPPAYVFLILAVLNAAVSLYIYKLVPEFLFRFGAWVVASLVYRIRVEGSERIPDAGPCIIVANHVSFVDWLLVASAVKTPVRFVMHHTFMKVPLVGFLFRDAKVIPIAPAKEDKDAMEKAFDRIAEELAAGEIVCIFPEGEITRTGAMNPFRRGIERIVARTPVPVVPVAIVGMWGSFFSRKDGDAMTKPFRRVWSRVTIAVGDPVAPGDVTAHGLAERVATLGGESAPAPAA